MKQTFKANDIVRVKNERCSRIKEHTYGIVLPTSDFSSGGIIRVSWKGYKEGHDGGARNPPFGRMSCWNYTNTDLEILTSSQLEFDFT